MSNPAIEKSWGKARAALIEHDHSLIGEGMVDPEKMHRLTTEALIEAAPKMRALGMNNGQIAKAAGVSRRTIERVLGPSNVAKRATNGGGSRALLSQSDQNDWRTPRKYLETRAYAWSSPIEGSTKRRFFAVLGIPPIVSPLDAVRAAIVQESRASK
jgi:transposase